MPVQFRRIITGHDAEGRSIISNAAPPPKSLQIGGEIGATFFEVWNTAASPAPVRGEPEDPVPADIVLSPPKHGTRLRVIDFQPVTRGLTPDEAKAAFGAFGGAHSLDAGSGPKRHPLMHRTETIDYGIVLEGEITMLMDEGEIVACAGDIVIQRGTNHAWVNRSGALCRIAFILIDGRFEGGLA